MRTSIRLRLPVLAVALVAAAMLVAGSAAAQSSLLAGVQQGSFFAPCDWSGSGPPPVATCTNTAPAVTASCDPTGTSTISFARDGFIPTGGSFTETVTATIGPQDGPPSSRSASPARRSAPSACRQAGC
ncbi:MAG TPA: hypothetical protein VKC62_08575 [Gaiellaceae bacterium]|nr:hypothetical protein [Gaiellaceae bacterium]